MTGTGRLWLRFGRFNLVGLLGVALQLVLMALLTNYYAFGGVAATPIAVELTLLHNFLWHERFTWRDRKAPGFAQAAIRLTRFHAANGVISLCGNTLLTYWLVERLKLPAVPSALAAIGLCALVNFRVADRWVYAISPATRRPRINSTTPSHLAPKSPHETHPRMYGNT
jgi:putative flippase GtrA